MPTQSILISQLAALSIGLGLQILLCGCARFVSRQDWLYAYFVWICALGSFLSLSLWQANNWPVYLGALIIVVCGVLGWIRPPIRCTIKPSKLWWLVAIVLTFELGWSAFPAYRYDQWHYHLLVSKIVTHFGTLPTPIFNDHIFFTGGYEYLFLLPRLLIYDDVILQGVADTLTVSTMLVLLVSFFAGSPKNLGSAWLWLFAIAILIAFPEHQAIVNAKPDVVLIGATLLAGHALMRNRHFWFGLLMIAPLSLKITWIHPAIALGSMMVVHFAKTRRLNLRSLGLGCFIGILIGLPIWVKNIYFFGNPIHPAQFLWFDSSYWSEVMAQNWKQQIGGARSLKSYLDELLEAFIHTVINSKWIFAMILTTAGVILWKKKSLRTLARSDEFLWLIGFGVFVIVWPVFFRGAIFPRFVFSVCAFFLPFCAQSLRYVSSKKWAFTVCMIPLVFNGSFEVKFLRMSQALTQSYQDYFADDHHPVHMFYYAQIANQHSQDHFSSQSFTDTVIELAPKSV